MHPPYKNRLLAALSPAALARLELHPADLPVGREIEFPGQHIDHLIFIEDGIATMTVTFQDGSQTEVALAGTESVLGASSMMGTKRSLNRVYMQIGGYGYTSRTTLATLEFKRGEQFHDLTLRYLQAQFIQCAQTAGCNAHHTIEQRLARWLLLCADRHGDRMLPLSQEYIGDMLGVTRSSVTVVAHSFQERNLIQYSRGKIYLLDLPGLEKLACECYRAVRDHLTNFAEYDDGFSIETSQVHPSPSS
jgi:CRP-like cAMP-binding protein